MHFPQMPNSTPPTPTPPPPPSPPLFQRPGLQKLFELALVIGLAYISARYGIPIPPPQVPAQAPQPAEKMPTAGPAIVGATDYQSHTLVRLRADNVPAGAATLWRVSPNVPHMNRATTSPDRFEFAAPPGVYDVELLVISQGKDGLSVGEVFHRVTVGQPKVDPKTDPKAEAKPDPVNALARISTSKGGCTACVVGPRRADGRWDVLTASHCVLGVGDRATMRMKDGRVLGIRVVVHQRGPDLAWCVTEDVVESLPFANLAAVQPSAGVRVWHMGYGVDKPGNREDGVVNGVSGAQLRFTLSVSPGDSGGGILNSETGELVSTVCCTEGFARRVTMYGASTNAIRAARPGAVNLAELPEVAPEPRACPPWWCPQLAW